MPLRHRCLLLMLVLLLPFGAGAQPKQGQAVDGGKLVIEIKGISDELLSNVEAYLSRLQPDGKEGLSAAALPFFERRAVTEIRSALAPFGYYNVTVDSRVNEEGPGQVSATFTIDPGPRTEVAAVDITLSGPGAEDPALQQARQDFPLAAGDALLDQSYEKGKRGLLKAALGAGYALARFDTSQIRVDPDLNSATIVLHLETERAFRFGLIIYHQEV